MINLERLKDIVRWAEKRLATIKQKYPDLRPYLVFSSPQGQIDIESRPVQILKEFPSMILDGQEKRQALAIVADMEQGRRVKDQAEETGQGDNVVDACLRQVLFNDNTTIELRFGVLKYQHIWALQNDDLIDRHLTMQSKASIRVVLSDMKRVSSEIEQRRNQQI